MRILVGVFFLVLAAGPSYGQTKNEPECPLQELAVEAALGDPEAHYNLGVAFHRGVDVPQDLGKAAVMWRLARNAGVVEAHNNLGDLTYYGKGVKQDYAEGLRLWRMAAEKGFAESQVHIADAYSDGRYLKQDFVEAYAWAKTGEHFSAGMRDARIAKQVAAMAEKTLAEARRNITEAQVREAEKKATEYIAKYNPK